MSEFNYDSNYEPIQHQQSYSYECSGGPQPSASQPASQPEPAPQKLLCPEHPLRPAPLFRIVDTMHVLLRFPPQPERVPASRQTQRNSGSSFFIRQPPFLSIYAKALGRLSSFVLILYFFDTICIRKCHDIPEKFS